MQMTLDGLKATRSAAHTEAHLVVVDAGGMRINTASVSGIQRAHVVSASITGGI